VVECNQKKGGGEAFSNKKESRQRGPTRPKGGKEIFVSPPYEKKKRGGEKDHSTKKRRKSLVCVYLVTRGEKGGGENEVFHIRRTAKRGKKRRNVLLTREVNPNSPFGG